MRIAFLADPRTQNAFYRAIGPMTELMRHHDVLELWSEDGHVPSGALRGREVLLVHRYANERAHELMRSARESGVAVVWDEDDDIGSVPKGSTGYRRFGGVNGAGRLHGMQRILRLADLVTTPSPELARRLVERGAKEAKVIENYLPEWSRASANRRHRGVTIGWVAGGEHHLDVERLPIRETLQRLLDERPDVNVVTIGQRLGLNSQRYGAIDVVPLQELSRHIAQFDIGIAPIADIAFNRARSNVKLKEYAAAGAPWLASPIGPYAGMGERQGGRLVADDRWHEELAHLVDKARERRKLARRGARWVAGQTIARNAHVWETTFADVVERTRRAGALQPV